MPRWLRHYLNRNSLKSHLARALALGLGLRLLSAYFVYGPQALDDYKHGVWPAYQFFAGLPLDIPSYRSHLLIWFLAGFVEVASWFNVTSALGQVRAMYCGLALTSLVGIYGTYPYVQSVRSRIFQSLALYFVAIFPLMPFVSTRAFGEAVALNLVLLAFGILELARRKDRIWIWTGGFLILGVATLFRFHVGLVFFSYLGLLLYYRNWRGVIGAAIGGLVTLGLQGAVDFLSGKAALGTLFIYLAENEGGGARYGVSPWYNPWLFVFVVSLAPFSLVLWGALPSLWRRHKFIVLPFLVFVTAHSLAAHKEERFLYPILGLELCLLAHLWAANALNRRARKIFAPTILVITLLVLPVVCFVNTQEGEIEAAALTERRYGNLIYLDHHSFFGKSRFQFYFLRPPSEMHPVEDFSAHQVDEALIQSRSGARAVVLITSEPTVRAQLEALAGIKTIAAQCLELESSGSLVDRLLYSLNPKHNQRRRPTWYLVCERSEHA